MNSATSARFRAVWRTANGLSNWESAFVANGTGRAGRSLMSAAAQPRVRGRFIPEAMGRDSLGREWLHEYAACDGGVCVRRFCVPADPEQEDMTSARTKVLPIDSPTLAKPEHAGENAEHQESPTSPLEMRRTVCVLRTHGRHTGRPGAALK